MGRKITKSDREAWNRVLANSSKQDYDKWVERSVAAIEKADAKGDINSVYNGVRALSGKSKIFQTTQSTKTKDGIIGSDEEVGKLWNDFLEDKFSRTELERARATYADLGPPQGADDLTREKFQLALKRMKNQKAAGPDVIPAEVWKNSMLAQSELYFFQRQVWKHECTPKSLILCIFVMIHKKGSVDNCANYCAIGLLNDAYKILSVCLLNRLLKEVECFLSEWQSGFCKEGGCNDNLLLLKIIYDNVFKGNKHCVVTYIDFAATFDSISHKFLDEALGQAGADRKSRAIFRQIYASAQGAVRIRGADGKHATTEKFTVTEKRRHHAYKATLSTLCSLYLLALNALVKKYDTSGQGISVGEIN